MTCTETAAKGISCVGVSSMSSRQDDAEDEAFDSALDATANAIAVRIDDATWKRAVVPIYQAARDAKLAAFDRDSSNTSARRDVREARNAVGRILRATSAGAVPPAPTGRYWEEYASPDGKRVVAFAQVSLGATELAKLAAAYAKQDTALGVMMVGLFRSSAGDIPSSSRARSSRSRRGPAAEARRRHAVHRARHSGRDVTDAPAFAKLATDEHAAGHRTRLDSRRVLKCRRSTDRRASLPWRSRRPKAPTRLRRVRDVPPAVAKAAALRPTAA